MIDPENWTWQSNLKLAKKKIPTFGLLFYYWGPTGTGSRFRSQSAALRGQLGSLKSRWDLRKKNLHDNIILHHIPRQRFFWSASLMFLQDQQSFGRLRLLVNFNKNLEDWNSMSKIVKKIYLIEEKNGGHENTIIWGKIWWLWKYSYRKLVGAGVGADKGGIVSALAPAQKPDSATLIGGYEIQGICT